LRWWRLRKWRVIFWILLEISPARGRGESVGNSAQESYVTTQHRHSFITFFTSEVMTNVFNCPDRKPLVAIQRRYEVITQISVLAVTVFLLETDDVEIDTGTDDTDTG
jgi:hypothetical protein